VPPCRLRKIASRSLAEYKRLSRGSLCQSLNDFLNAGEGVATNVLADRLQRLEAFDILSKHRDARDRRRFVYRLTAKGIDLAPVLVELALWSARHEKTAAPAATLRKMRENRERYVEGLRRAWEKSGR